MALSLLPDNAVAAPEQLSACVRVQLMQLGPADMPAYVCCMVTVLHGDS